MSGIHWLFINTYKICLYTGNSEIFYQYIRICHRITRLFGEILNFFQPVDLKKETGFNWKKILGYYKYVSNYKPIVDMQGDCSQHCHATNSLNSMDFKQENLITPTGLVAKIVLTYVVPYPTSLLHFMGKMKKNVVNIKKNFLQVF